jgi:hypothetical protein
VFSDNTSRQSAHTYNHRIGLSGDRRCAVLLLVRVGTGVRGACLPGWKLVFSLAFLPHEILLIDRLDGQKI